jgi:hypothetical protein
MLRHEEAALVTDELWRAIEPLLPAEPPMVQRAWSSDWIHPDQDGSSRGRVPSVVPWDSLVLATRRAGNVTSL